MPDAPAAPVGKRRTFRKFTFRGVDLDALLTLKPVDVLPLLTARARRKINRGLTRKPLALIKKLNKAKKEAPEHEKPAAVKTHLRNMIIIPEMIGSVVGVYNGKVFNSVEIKPEVCLVAILRSRKQLPLYFCSGGLTENVIVLFNCLFYCRWLGTTWVSFPSPTSPLSMGAPVLVPLTPRVLFHSSSQLRYRSALRASMYFLYSKASLLLKWRRTCPVYFALRLRPR